MNVYTSYFAKMNKIPQGYVTIAICGGLPKFYNGLAYKKLAPKYDFFQKWKQTHDNDYYIENYNKLVLDVTTPEKVLEDFKQLTNDAENVVMLCYEKPSDFCHRHLVANWFREHNIPCEELKI